MSYKVAYDHWVADRQERLRRRRAPAPLAETPANDEARSGYTGTNLPSSDTRSRQLTDTTLDFVGLRMPSSYTPLPTSHEDVLTLDNGSEIFFMACDEERDLRGVTPFEAIDVDTRD
jgi:hypothetical protein